MDSELKDFGCLKSNCKVMKWKPQNYLEYDSTHWAHLVVKGGNNSNA